MNRDSSLYRPKNGFEPPSSTGMGIGGGHGSHRVGAERSEGGKNTHHTRYFISSARMKAKDFLEAIGQHWSIENRLHGVLDIAFRADDARLRAENAAQNFVVLKHMARNLLQNVKGSKVGIKIRRFEAACNDRFLLNILVSCPNSMRLPWVSWTPERKELGTPQDKNQQRFLRDP